MDRFFDVQVNGFVHHSKNLAIAKVLNSIFKPVPMLTILSYELGSVLIIPNGSTNATVAFNDISLKVPPTFQQISYLRKKLRNRNAENTTCEVRDGKLSIELSLRIPRFFPQGRIVSKSKRLMRDVADWAKPMTEVISDDILGNLRWNNPDFEGRLNAGQSKITTDLWIDLFVESGEGFQQTLDNIARLRRVVYSWGELEPRIKKEIMRSIYPQYHRWCDERRESIRHDEKGFWAELSVASLSAMLDGSIAIRYHSGEMFLSYRVEAVILDDQITCNVTY